MFNPLQTKRRLFYLKTQSVSLCKIFFISVVLCIVCFVSFCVLFVCNVYCTVLYCTVLYYRHRLATQLQLKIYNKNQSVYAVSGTSRCLFSDKYKTHKYSVGRAYSC